MIEVTRYELELDKFRNTLKQKGLKATPQRVVVHSAMLELGHASADMVTEKINNTQKDTTDAKPGRITLASVYNTLSTMADLGVYHRRMSSNNKMYFDVNTFKHFHLYDRVNHSYRDVIDDNLTALIEASIKGRRFKGYSIESVDVQIICRPSKQKRK